MLINIVKNVNKNSPWKLLHSCQPSKCNFSTIPETRKIIFEKSAIKKYIHSQNNKSGGGGAGRTFIFTIGSVVLAGGGILGYAKYDSDFRKTLALYIPYTGTILDYFDHNSGISLYEDAKKSLLALVSSGDDRSTASSKIDAIPVLKEYKAPPPIMPILKTEVKQTPENYSEIRIKDENIDKKQLEINIAGEPKPKLKDIDLEKLTDLERTIGETSAEAINAYSKATNIILSYNHDIEHIIDQAVNEIKPELLENIRQKTKSKNECIKRAQTKAKEAEQYVTKIKELISRADFKAPENTKTVIRNKIAKTQDEVNKAKKQLQLEIERGNITDKYWDKVEKARKHFSEELETIFPNVDISKKQLSLEQDQIDLFVLHIYANVLFYQKELAKTETLLQNKIDQAIEAARKGGMEPLTVAQICEAVEQEKRKLTTCFQQQILKLRTESETELREQLKRQSQAFNDHLNEAIKIREIEIEKTLNRRFDELLEEERCKFKLQLSAMVGRLHGLDEGIKARNTADASSKQAQALWSACQSLLRAIRAGCPGIAWQDQIRSLEPEINAIVKAAAPKDEIVSVIVQSIPKEALDRGIYPEDALKERFFKVEKLARNLDLIAAEGAALPVHILSYLQSILLVKSASPIPKSELNDEKVDFSKLTTNRILQRARYWLDRGDFAQALKYMNLLKGAPRCIASQWMNETRILLETQQAATTLMAHAASSGLMYL